MFGSILIFSVGWLVGRSLLFLFSHANTKIIAYCVPAKQQQLKKKILYILNWMSLFSIEQ